MRYVCTECHKILTQNQVIMRFHFQSGMAPYCNKCVKEEI